MPLGVLPDYIGLVGREPEMAKIEQHLQEAITGEGSLVLLEGEAGVGKTRMLQVLSQRLRESHQGMTVLQGRCIEGTAPYHTFVEALSSLGSEDVLGSVAGRIRELFLIHKDGRLLAYYSEGGRELDEDLVSGMLTAIRDFIDHSFRPGSRGTLDELHYGDNYIAMEEGELAYIAAVLSPPAPAWIREAMGTCLQELEHRYRETIDDWHGKRSPEIIAMEERLVTLAKELPTSVDSMVDRSRRFEELAQRLDDLCAQAPVLLLLDDLQWMDASSLDLLHYVSRRALDTRLMVLGTYRPEDLVELGAPEGTHQLTRLLRRMSRENLYSLLKLRRLDEQQTRSLVNLVFSANTLGDDLHGLLYSTTDGNPFFVMEVLAQLVEDGTISQQESVWTSDKVTSLSLPSTVRDVILRRVERLSPEEQEVLNVMAVAGVEWSFDVIQKASEIMEDELIEIIDRLVRLRVLQESAGEDRYRFDQELFREVVYDRMSRGTRRLLHHKVGGALEGHHKDNLEEVIFELASHFSYTRDEERALQYSMMAGERALQAFAPEEAVAHFERVLVSIEETPSMGLRVKAAELHNYLGAALDTLGRQREALEHFQHALNISEELGLPRLAAVVHRNLGRLYQRRQDWPRSMTYLQKALDGYTSLSNERGMGDIHRSIAQVFWHQGEYEMARSHLQEALELQQKMRNRAEMGAIYTDLANIDASKGDRQRARLRYEQARELVESAGDLIEMARVYNNLGTLEEEEGNFTEASKLYSACIDTAQRCGDRRVYAFGLLGLTGVEIELGEVGRAQDHTVEGLAAAEQLQDKILTAAFHRSQGLVYGLLGQHEDLDAQFTRAERLYDQVNAPFEIANLYLLWSRHYKEQQDDTRSRDLADRARRRARQIGAKKLVEEADELLKEHAS